MPTCDVCHKQFDTEKGLKIHQTKMHGNKSSRKLEMAVADRPAMQPTVQTHNGNMIVETKYLLATEHNASSSQENDAVCNLCQGVFKNERGLKQHLSRTNNVGPFIRHKVSESSVNAADFEELFSLRHDEIHLKHSGQDHHLKYGARKLADGVATRFQASRPEVESSYKRLQHDQRGTLGKNNIKAELMTFNTNGQDVVATPDHVEIKPMIKSNGELNRVTKTCTEDSNEHPAATTKTFDNNTANSVEILDPSLSKRLNAVISLQPFADPNDVTRKKDKGKLREAASDICYAINSLTTALNDDVNGSPLKWTCQYAGSQYEITETPKHKEFDVMFTCLINGAVARPTDKAGFYHLIWTEPVTARLVLFASSAGGHHRVMDPKLFKNYFRHLVATYNPRRRLRVDESQPATSPGVKAVIMVNKYSPQGPVTTCPYEIDLTPCVELSGWPQDGRSNRPRWIPAKLWREAREKYHLVAKCHPSEITKAAGLCTLWRVSFSHAEKTIMRAADYARGVDGKTMTCRKQLVRKLKLDLKRWRREAAGGSDVIPDISSFMMKTVAMWLFEEYSHTEHWVPAQFHQRYIDALRLVCRSFSTSAQRSTPFLAHYFLPHYNILEVLLASPDGIQQCAYVCHKAQTIIQLLTNITHGAVQLLP